MKTTKLASALWAVGLGPCLIPSVQAADLQALEKQLQMLQAEIKELKASAATKKEVSDLNDQVSLQAEIEDLKVAAAAAAKDAPDPNAQGGETSVRIYGAIEVSAIRDVGSYTTGDHFSLVSSQPLKSTNPSTGMTRLTAQTSRFGFETSTPTPNGPLTTKIEGDFLSQDTTSNLLMRHAYGEYAGFLIGQTWSTFMDNENYPETVDYNGPPGASYSYPIQLRYTHDVPNVAKFQLALEKNGSSSTPQSPTRDMPPSLVLRVDKAFASGAALSVRAIQHTEYDTTTTASARGWGFGISGSYKFTDTLTGFAQLTQADSDVAGALVSGSNAPVVVGSEFKADRTRGVVLGLNTVLNAQWRASLAYGQVESLYEATDAYALALGTATGNKRLHQWHLNAFYTPVKNVHLGAELIGGSRSTYSGDSGELNRISLLARYTFN